MDTLRLYKLAKKGAMAEMIRYSDYIKEEEDESIKEFWNEKLNGARKEWYYLNNVLKALEEVEN